MSITSRSPSVLALAETLGISKQRCITLLAASSGDVERAADIFYSQQQQQQKQRTGRGRKQSRSKKQRPQPCNIQQPVDEPVEKKEQDEQAGEDEHGEDEAAAGVAEYEGDEQANEDDQMPQLESPPSAQPSSALPAEPSAAESLSPSSSVLPSHRRSAGPLRLATAPAIASSASRLKAELGVNASSSSSSSSSIVRKPALFASSSATAVKREPTAASSSASASLASSSDRRSKAPSLFSLSASSQTKAETAAFPAAAPAAISSPAPIRPPSPTVPASFAAAAAPPRPDRVSVRIIDTINCDTPPINMRFPLDTSLQKVYAELERRGFPGVKLYHAKSELSPELTPRELCLVDRCVLEMEYVQQQQSTAVEGPGVGDKRTAELKEAEPPGTKRRRLESRRPGKEEKAQDDMDEELDESKEEAAPSVGRAEQSIPAASSSSSSSSPSSVEPASLHVEHPVTFSRLRLASVALHVRARTKTMAKRSHNFFELYTAIRAGATPSTMSPATVRDEQLLTLINEINSGQRHPIGVEVKWQRVQAAGPTDSSSEPGSGAVRGSVLSGLSERLALLRAAAGLSDGKKQQARHKWQHTFDVELYLLPVCIGWSITHMNELLELLWGDRWRQLMSGVWSERYQPGDGKPVPPMSEASLLRMAQRFEYHATLNESVLSPHAPDMSASASTSSAAIGSNLTSSPFPFRAPRPYESSETLALRYLVQRERQKPVSSWLDASELEPHQLSLESCVGLSLRDYQQQSLLWMLGQELRESVSESFWIECRVDGQPLLYSPLFQQWRMGPLEPVRGGLLCDTMGLGKTIVSLALLNLRPAPDDFFRASLAASYVASPSHPVRSRATLIIAPVSLVPQWEAELRQHSLRPLRIYCFYGSNRETDARVIAQYDVVLTTYGVLVSDTAGQRFRRRKGAPSIFHCIEWWRVLVDEGHQLKATSTAQSKAATAILSQQRHILTGTPLKDSVIELRGFFSFLQCAVLADSPSFWSHMQAASRAVPSAVPPPPAEERSYRSMPFPPYAVYAVAEEMFCRLSMRHTKDQPFNGRSTLAPLPPRSDVIHKVDFTAAQRAAYEELYAFARRKWDELLRRGANSSIVIPAMSALLPLRQACAGTIINMAEVRQREAEAAERVEEAKRAEESRRAHAASAQLAALPAEVGENDDEAGEQDSNRQFPYATTLPYNSLTDECVVCLSEFSLPLQTKCGHLFCADCILAVIDMESEPTCPQCRARVTRATLRRPRPPPKTPPPPAVKDEAADASSSSAAAAAASSAPASSPSVPADNVLFDSKLEVVLSQLLQLQRSEPSTKALVFSQFTSTLSYLASRLTALNVSVHRISGDMTMTARRRVLHNFNTSTAFSVFLLTPRVGAVGLTLTSASHCYLIEPALNWTLTEQAVGRVHRLGQQRPVTCIHYVMRGSVEEKIEAITREKRAAQGQGGGAGGAAADGAASNEGVDASGSVGIGSDAMVGLNSMGSMKKDAAAYRMNELERLFEK